MKLALKVNTETFKKSTDGPEDWQATGVRCAVCKVEVDGYYCVDGHDILECLLGLAKRIEALEKTK